jgi:hypothetical protein
VEALPLGDDQALEAGPNARASYERKDVGIVFIEQRNCARVEPKFVS